MGCVRLVVQAGNHNPHLARTHSPTLYLVRTYYMHITVCYFLAQDAD